MEKEGRQRHPNVLIFASRFDPPIDSFFLAMTTPLVVMCIHHCKRLFPVESTRRPKRTANGDGSEPPGYAFWLASPCCQRLKERGTKKVRTGVFAFPISSNSLKIPNFRPMSGQAIAIQSDKVSAIEYACPSYDTARFILRGTSSWCTCSRGIFLCASGLLPELSVAKFPCQTLVKLSNHGKWQRLRNVSHESARRSHVHTQLRGSHSLKLFFVLFRFVLAIQNPAVARSRYVTSAVGVSGSGRNLCHCDLGFGHVYTISASSLCFLFAVSSYRIRSSKGHRSWCWLGRREGWGIADISVASRHEKLSRAAELDGCEY